MGRVVESYQSAPKSPLWPFFVHKQGIVASCVGRRIVTKSGMRLRVRDLPPDLQKQAIEQGARDGGILSGEMPRRKNKYNAKPVMVANRRFDSKAEARRYEELQLLVQGKRIKDLVLQPEYVLIPEFVDNQGKRHRKTLYIADFQYTDVSTGKIIIEDVKSAATAQNASFRLKWRMMHYLYRDRTDVELVANIT